MNTVEPKAKESHLLRVVLEPTDIPTNVVSVVRELADMKAYGIACMYASTSGNRFLSHMK